MTPSNPSWRPLAACALATLLLLAYTTVVTVSATSIADDVGAGFTVSQWVIDVYTLALASLVLGMGTLGDRIGHRRLFLVGLSVFGLAALACAVSTSGPEVIAARAIQGVGGSAMFATAVPLLTQNYEGRYRAVAFAIWGAVAGAGSTVGTVAGGVVTEFVGWRWLFLAAIPLCVAAVALGAASLPQMHGRQERLDVVGTALITVAMTALTVGVIDMGEHGLTSWLAIGCGALTVASMSLFIRFERRALRPVLPAHLFATRGFTGVILVGFAYYFGAFAALPVLSRWLEVRLRMTPLQAALVLSIQLIVFVAVSLLLSARLHNARPSWALGGGTVLTGLACLPGTALVTRPDWTTLVVVLALTGVGAGIVSPILPAVAVTLVPPERAGTAAAAANAARQLGLTIGVALCGALSQPSTVSRAPTGGLVAALVVSGLTALCGGMVGFTLLRSAER